MTDESLELLLHRDALLTENALRSFYEQDEALKPLLDAEQYSLFAGGKRIRPALVIEFCKLFGGEEEAAVPFAAALEMTHTASLIHDDLPCMDNDDLRRGKPTNHKVYGEATALLAGDSLFIGAYEAVATNSLVSAEARVKAGAYLANSAGRYGMVGGQIMDMEGEKRSLSLDELLRLHSLKTGALITASAVLGAIAADVDFNDPRMEKVITYSENIGLAFQVVDDLLDRIGDVKILGKNTQMDSAMGKTTFLSFYSVEQAQEYAEKLTCEAVDAISAFPESEALCSLAVWLCHRKK